MIINLLQRLFDCASQLNSMLLIYTIRTISNILIPIFYKLTTTPHVDTKENDCITISLTSIPVRISKLWIVIESILRQSYKANRIVLYLSKEDFPNGENGLPKSLLKLKGKGLEIFFYDENLYSHKKYFYSFQDIRNKFVITIDDDIIYPDDMIYKLINSYKTHPDCIIARYGQYIRKKNNKILPFNTWDNIFYENPSNLIFFGSGGGTLFPIKNIHKGAFQKEVFLDICKYADDVWLNVYSRLSGYKIYLVDNKSTNILNIQILNDIRLTKINCVNNQNDVQLQNVNRYINKEYHISNIF